MGGCRCSFKSCRNTTKTTQNIHFFHYPVKQKERCKAWINKACKPKFFDLDEYQLRNKVICEVHFENRCFLNAEKKRLLPQAIPTLDGPFLYDEPSPNRMKQEIKPYVNSPKLDDVQLLPANEDGTVFILDTCPSFKVNKEVKSYVINDDALLSIEKKHDNYPRIKEEPVFNDHEQGEYILGDNNHFFNTSTPLRKPPLKQQNFPNKPNFEILNNDLSPQPPGPDKAMSKEAVEALVCQTVESKCLWRIEQHTKEIDRIKKVLKASKVNKKNLLSKNSVLRYLKLRLPPSLHTLVTLSLNDDYELSEEDENFFKNLHDSSVKTYNFLSDDCSWRMPIIEVHEGEPECMDEN